MIKQINKQVLDMRVISLSVDKLNKDMSEYLVAGNLAHFYVSFDDTMLQPRQMFICIFDEFDELQGLFIRKNDLDKSIELNPGLVDTSKNTNFKLKLKREIHILGRLGDVYIVDIDVFPTEYKTLLVDSLKTFKE